MRWDRARRRRGKRTEAARVVKKQAGIKVSPMQIARLVHCASG